MYIYSPSACVSIRILTFPYQLEIPVTQLAFRWIFISVYSMLYFLVKFHEKILSHMMHLNGFSPMCIPRCISTVLFYKELLAHRMHKD